MLDFEIAYTKGVCQLCEKGSNDGVTPHLYTIGTDRLAYTCNDHRILLPFGDESVVDIAA